MCKRQEGSYGGVVGTEVYVGWVRQEMSKVPVAEGVPRP